MNGITVYQMRYNKNDQLHVVKSKAHDWIKLRFRTSCSKSAMSVAENFRIRPFNASSRFVFSGVWRTILSLLDSKLFLIRANVSHKLVVLFVWCNVKTVLSKNIESTSILCFKSGFRKKTNTVDWTKKERSLLFVTASIYEPNKEYKTYFYFLKNEQIRWDSKPQFWSSNDLQAKTIWT